jgi:hypothetical protein
MITKLIETKLVNYLKADTGIQNENIVAGISDSKRELPCIVAWCDSATDYPSVPVTAGLFVMSLKVMVMQSNTESVDIFRDRSDRLYNALSLFDTMRTAFNTDTTSGLFVYGFRNLKVDTSVEEQHFVVNYSLEAIAS